MQKTKLAIVAVAVLLSMSEARASDDRQVCEKVRAQIREIRAKMRNGYTAAQGVRYEERLRKLKKKRYRLCR